MGLLITPWLVGAFSSNLPSEAVLTLWAACIKHGRLFIYRVVVAILDLLRPRLLAADCPMTLLEIMTQTLQTLFDVQPVLKAAAQVRWLSRGFCCLSPVNRTVCTCLYGSDGGCVAVGPCGVVPSRPRVFLVKQASSTIFGCSLAWTILQTERDRKLWARADALDTEQKTQSFSFRLQSKTWAKNFQKRGREVDPPPPPQHRCIYPHTASRLLFHGSVDPTTPSNIHRGILQKICYF